MVSGAPVCILRGSISMKRKFQVVVFKRAKIPNQFPMKLLELKSFQGATTLLDGQDSVKIQHEWCVSSMQIATPWEKTTEKALRRSSRARLHGLRTEDKVLHFFNGWPILCQDNESENGSQAKINLQGFPEFLAKSWWSIVRHAPAPR
ncbi:hypothetical protein HAX54_030739 [Datura stramonium]|uniref:Uncharacterized protein n=1 Tax=Datura stramonium TaxID=4076 RepID=A0ABS8V8S4_DATST|nr:hypothetical protein [Datura stramonium]